MVTKLCMRWYSLLNFNIIVKFGYQSRFIGLFCHRCIWGLHHLSFEKSYNCSVNTTDALHTCLYILQWRQMSATGSQSIGNSTVCSKTGSGYEQRNHQSSELLLFSPHHWKVDSTNKKGSASMAWRHHNKTRGPISLQWRHNWPDSVSNHQPQDCLLNRLFRRRSKKASKLRVTGLCVGNSPGTGEFPAQMASNAENISIWWRHHVIEKFQCQNTCQLRRIFQSRSHSAESIITSQSEGKSVPTNRRPSQYKWLPSGYRIPIKDGRETVLSL